MEIPPISGAGYQNFKDGVLKAQVYNYYQRALTVMQEFDKRDPHAIDDAKHFATDLKSFFDKNSYLFEDEYKGYPKYGNIMKYLGEVKELINPILQDPCKETVWNLNDSLWKLEYNLGS